MLLCTFLNVVYHTFVNNLKIHSAVSLHTFGLLSNCNWDIHTSANSVDPDQTSPRGAV